MKFTQLEKDILIWFQQNHPSLSLENHIKNIDVLSREETNSGFFTNLNYSNKVNPIISEKNESKYWLENLIISAPELSAGAIVLLHIINGYLDSIEVVSLQNGHPLKITNYELENY